MTIADSRAALLLCARGTTPAAKVWRQVISTGHRALGMGSKLGCLALGPIHGHEDRVTSVRSAPMAVRLHQVMKKYGKPVGSHLRSTRIHTLKGSHVKGGDVASATDGRTSRVRLSRQYSRAGDSSSGTQAPYTQSIKSKHRPVWRSVPPVRVDRKGSCDATVGAVRHLRFGSTIARSWHQASVGAWRSARMAV